jgi:PAS domain S-box-containing protein
MAKGASEVGDGTPARGRETTPARSRATTARSRRQRVSAAGKKTAGHGWVGSAEQLHLVLQEAGDAITVVDMSGELRYANKAAATAMGFADPAEAVRLPRKQLMARFELLDAEGRPLPEDALPGRRVQREGSAPETLVRFRILETGEERWSLVRPTLVRGSDGKPQFVISAFHDVTALKATERRLTLLADAGSVLGKSVDYQESLNELARMVVPDLADWCVVDVVEQESGVRRVAVAHEDPSLVALAEQVQRRWPSNIEEGATGDVLKTGEPLLVPLITEEQLAAAARDADHEKHLRALGLGSVVILPLVARERVLGLLTLVRSDQSRAFSEDELPLFGELAARAGTAVDNARLLHEATEAVRLRDDFLAIASHDMRTPLAAILGYVQLALRRARKMEKSGGEKLVEYLTAAENMAGRLTDLVADLMDVSLLRSGRPVALEPVELEIGQVAERVIEGHRKLARAHRIVFDHVESVVVQADIRRLERVLDNLLSNAVKFSPGRGEIRVTIDRDAAMARIRISDQGIGIPNADLPELFTRFRRASNVAGVRGTGLGLAGSREIVRQMGGDIEVHSDEGEGSTFTVTLPTSRQ